MAEPQQPQQEETPAPAPSEALTVVGQVDLATAHGLGLEDTFIRPTYVELIQRTSRREGATPGTLHDALTDTSFEEIQAVPLMVFKGRALWPEEGGLGSKPICRSNDGVVPSPFAEYPQHADCATCPKSSWTNYDRKTGKGKPECKEKWQLLFVMRETGLPRKLTIGGMSLKPVKAMLENIKQDIIMAKAKGENRNIFDYTFTIQTLEVKGNQGTYYVLKFANVKKIADAGEFGPLFEQYVLSARAKAAERAAEEEAAKAVENVVGDQTAGADDALPAG